MQRISMLDKLNDSSKMAAIDTTGYKELYLDAESIIPSEENFYAIEDVEELADNMQMVGQLQPLLIGRIDGEYRLMAGHRRLAAILLNNKRGYVKKAWCFGKEMDQIEFMLCLLSTNAFNRKLNDFNLLEQAEKMKYWVEKAVDAGKLQVVGKMRDFLAAKMGVSSTKMAQVEHINAHLTDEGKEALSAGEINFSKAYETSRLPKDEQSAVIHNKNLLSAEVRAMAQEMKMPKISYSADEDVQEKQDSTDEVVEINISIDSQETSTSDTVQPEQDVTDSDMQMLKEEMEKYHVYSMQKDAPCRRKKYEIVYRALKHYYNYLESSKQEVDA